MKVEKKATTEQSWTIDDLQELYNLSLKHPNGDYASAEFWKKLRADKELSSRLQGIDAMGLQSLWQLILQKTQNSIKVFQSMLQDYVATKSRNTSLGEKIKNTLLEFFFGKTKKVEEEKSELKTEYSHTSTRVAAEEPLHLASKRSESEKSAVPVVEESKEISTKMVPSQPVVPSVGENFEFHVSTSERYPRLDLNSLVKKKSILTQKCNEIDKNWVKQIGEKGGRMEKFVELYNEVVGRKGMETWKTISIKVTEKKKPSEIKIDMMKRELKMLQQCYGKTVQEISELYTKCCGDFERMRTFLRGEFVPLWEVAEDLALKEPEDSTGFKNLLGRKGDEEIKKRKRFLGLVTN